ncbi:hypothetical protein [Sphingopyxis sp. 113P3]|uniref:hypothetical protein n=1 Tax=Sphingopyxis sp. (strain 113P3) TaxID=292913 RepID=UPI0006AD348C|nr:hypothetical protein [Sphingopyxis sp. 113P3]ALC13801.1 hypothetical protein LH20_17730 [Sphingopyxis sp. 113P3]
MTIPLLSELRQPPVPGRYYMVPVIDFIYCNREGQWPTLGPLHHDREEIGFDPLHFHVDLRFLTARQTKQIRRWYSPGTAEATVSAAPLNYRGRDVPKKPYLAKRRCRVPGWAYSPPGRPLWLDAFDRRFGEVAEPRRLADGRLLCPHRKVDLSSFEPDAEGIVTCPLHGLRVRCGSAPQ